MACIRLNQLLIVCDDAVNECGAMNDIRVYSLLAWVCIVFCIKCIIHNNLAETDVYRLLTSTTTNKRKKKHKNKGKHLRKLNAQSEQLLLLLFWFHSPEFVHITLDTRHHHNILSLRTKCYSFVVPPASPPPQQAAHRHISSYWHTHPD